MEAIPKTVDVAVAAKLLNKSEKTIYRWLEDPRSPLKGFVFHTGKKAVLYSSIEKCLVPIEKFT